MGEWANRVLKTAVNFNADAVARRSHRSRYRGARAQKWIEDHIAFHRVHIDQAVGQLKWKCRTPQPRYLIGKPLAGALNIQPNIRIPDISLFPKQRAFAPVLFFPLRS